jgi:hypothetical protein
LLKRSGIRLKILIRKIRKGLIDKLFYESKSFMPAGNRGFINILVIIGISILVVLSGYFIFNKQSVEEITPRDAEFGSSVSLRVNERVRFGDGLVVILVEINDSRCKPDVVCIWAGELSSRFILLGGGISQFKEIRLGTATVESATQDGYTITLKGATENTATIAVVKAGGQIACTLEAKLCLDGSAVGRTGPNCEFAECPKADGDQVPLREGQRHGPLFVEKIYPDYITGLIYREYPVATDQGSPITMQIGDAASNGCTITLTLIKIENKTATFSEKTDYDRPCPICLAEGTLIDTPSGEIAVQDLKVGDKVWTKDPTGNRIAMPILTVSKTPAPLAHEMIHLKLMDGRELFVSPGHPVGDGRFIGELKKGDKLDRSRVIYLEKIPYGKNFTYDILPAGGTGFYWANGTLLDSTLH